MEYTNVINNRYKEIIQRPTIFPKFKIELVDRTETTVLKEIVQDIDASNAGSITINYQQGVRMGCTLNIINNAKLYELSMGTGYLWMGAKFKLYIGIYDTDKGDTYWFSEGVYYINNPVDNNNLSEKYITITGVDKFGFLGSELNYNQLIGTYHVDANNLIYDVIKSILALDIGNGYCVDTVEPYLDPLYKDEVLPYTIEKAPGAYLGDILIELANILGANIYYDKMGHLVVKSGTIDMSYSQEGAIWSFTDVLPEYMGSSISYNYSDVINVVPVVSNNVNDKIYSYVAENNNPSSPTRISLIGRKEMAPVETAMAYNAERAKDYAEYLLNKKSIVQTLINFTSSLIPHLDVDKVCNITDKYYNYQQQRFIIQSLNIPLNTTSTMNISASNVASLPYYDLLEGATTSNSSTTSSSDSSSGGSSGSGGATPPNPGEDSGGSSGGGDHGELPTG